MNWEDKTLFVGDNLHVLRGMNSETVDSIYLDPPFNSNRNYAAPIGSRAAGAAFKDAWTLSDIDLVEHQALKENRPGLYAVIDTAGTAHSKGMKSYLIMMAVRLLELRRVLKDMGSLYLHCDPTASHYLKLTLDAIFGRSNFRNEVIWRRATAKGLAKNRFASNHDVILSYGKTSKSTWNPQFEEYDPEYVKKFYRHVEPGTGRRYALDNIVNPNKDRPNLEYEFLGVHRVWRWTKERMQKAYDEGRIVQSKPGGVPRQKSYLDEQQGRSVDDTWTNIKAVQAQARERVGYPTQKPLALLERIIQASTDPDDVVLDPFCGCATTLVAANRLERQWVGIDLSAKAGELVVDRIKDSEGLFGDIQVREDIPQRTDLGPPLTTQERREYKRVLYGLQVGRCNGCNTHFERLEDFHMDHIVARARGGTDHDFNFQLLCGHCNSVKGKKTQAEFAAIISQKRKDFSWM